MASHCSQWHWDPWFFIFFYPSSASSVSLSSFRICLRRHWISVWWVDFERTVHSRSQTPTLETMRTVQRTTTSRIWSGKSFLPVVAVIAIIPFYPRLQSMIIHDDHLYILCGTNRWSYNTNVYDIHLPTLRSTHVGRTFNEIEDFVDGGRHVSDEVG